MSSKAGLGRGLGSLIPQDFDATLLIENGEQVLRIDVVKLSANPEQPRTIFNDDALLELAASIKQYGVVQPLVVSPHGATYIIIAGERRWRAAQLAGLKTVPSIVRTTKELERLELALVENVQRVDLSPLEQAVSIERLHQQFNLNYSTIAKRLGKSEGTVSNVVRLLQLPEAGRKALSESTITEGHARQLLALKDDPNKQIELLELIVKHSWSVRQAERFVNSYKVGFKDTVDAKKYMASETVETKRLTKQYGAPVRIHRMAKGGRVEIVFRTDDELAKLLRTLEK